MEISTWSVILPNTTPALRVHEVLWNKKGIEIKMGGKQKKRKGERKKESKKERKIEMIGYGVNKG